MARTVYGLKVAGAINAVPVDPVVLSFDFGAVMFTCALFRFRRFIPIARGTVIDQIREGMLVLDGERRIMKSPPRRADPWEVARVRQRLHRCHAPAGLRPRRTIRNHSGHGEAMRHYAVHQAALNDSRSLRVGTLILVDDVTGQKQAQTQLLEQQRERATLHERDRAARKLHDTLGQVLGSIKDAGRRGADIPRAERAFGSEAPPGAPGGCRAGCAKRRAGVHPWNADRSFRRRPACTRALGLPAPVHDNYGIATK